MKALASELEALGLSDYQNLHPERERGIPWSEQTASLLAPEISAAIEAKFGFEPHVVVIRDKDLAAAAAGNPFAESTTDSEGKALHLFFLAGAPRNIDRERLDTMQQHSERWQVSGRFLYLHAPDEFGDSKLAKQVERILGVTATGRNWRTVCALLDLSKRSG